MAMIFCRVTGSLIGDERAVEEIRAVFGAAHDAGLAVVVPRGDPAFFRQRLPDGVCLFGAEGGDYLVLLDVRRQRSQPLA